MTRKPVDAYREGYEQGRRDNIGGNLAQATIGMLRDDPGGHFAAGYHDGAGGKDFNPPVEKSIRVTRQPQQKGEWLGLLFLGLIWFTFVPVHFLIALCRKQPNRSETRWRGALTVIWVAVMGFGAYQAHQASTYRVQSAQPSGTSSTSTAPKSVKHVAQPSGYHANPLAFGPGSVWKFKESGLWEKIQEKCGSLHQQQSAFIPCIVSNMRQAGASAQAIAFTEEMKGEVYMGSFRKMGKVDLATMVAPVLNDPNTTDFILVNGTPHIVQLWNNARNTDITRDPRYPALRQRFPQITLWPMQNFLRMEHSSGGQRFIFGFVLMNGCRACEIAGSAEIGFDFDIEGRFIGTKLVQLDQPSGT